METTSLDNAKSQRRIERQKRREERRRSRQKLVELQSQVEPTKKRKSLPGFLGKHRHEISQWLRHYMLLIVKADDAQIPWLKEMPREERNKLINEYVEVSTFRTELDSYLEDEELESQAQQ